MAFAPIALTIPQYEDYPTYWLKAYEEGTTTPLVMATDATGGTTVAKFELDAQGFPVTAGDARLIPFIDGDYDLWLFPTEAEADANDTSGAIQLADDLNTDQTTKYWYATKALAAAVTFTSSDAGNKIFITSEDGGEFTVRFNVSAGTYADNGGTFCGTQFIPSGGDGTIGIVRNHDGDIWAHWFGAYGVDGTVDESVSIDAAFAYCITAAWSSISGEAGWMDGATSALQFRAGDYLYSGAGITTVGAFIKIRGAGKMLTRIRIPASTYLITTSGFTTIDVEGVHSYGGSGFLKETYSSANVAQGVRIVNNIFSEYTECAIGTTQATDKPFYNIEGNSFTGKDNGAVISICVPPGGGHNIRNNWFNQHRYAIKLVGEQLVDTALQNNRFGKLSNANNTAAIWIVPTTGSANQGRGVALSENTFGNENEIAGDHKILIAAEDSGSGSDFMDRQHSASTTTNKLYGITVDKNSFVFGDNVDKAIIVSYTENFSEFNWGTNYIEGTAPPAILDIVPARSDDNYRASDSILNISQMQNSGAKKYPSIEPAGVVIDPLSLAQENISVPNYWGAGADDGFVELLTSRDAFTNVNLSNAAKVVDTDILGGSSAAEITYSASSGHARYGGVTTGLIADRLAFAEIDLKVGATQPIEYVTVAIWTTSGNRILQRVVKVPSSWKRFVFPFIPPQSASAYIIAVEAFGDSYSSGVTDKVLVGRPAIYHANEACNYYSHLQALDGTWDGNHLILGTHHFWMNGNDYRGSIGAPASATDGALIQTLT